MRHDDAPKPPADNSPGVQHSQATGLLRNHGLMVHWQNLHFSGVPLKKKRTEVGGKRTEKRRSHLIVTATAKKEATAVLARYRGYSG